MWNEFVLWSFVAMTLAMQQCLSKWATLVGNGPKDREWEMFKVISTDIVSCGKKGWDWAFKSVICTQVVCTPELKAKIIRIYIYL